MHHKVLVCSAINYGSGQWIDFPLQFDFCIDILKLAKIKQLHCSFGIEIEFNKPYKRKQENKISPAKKKKKTNLKLLQKLDVSL